MDARQSLLMELTYMEGECYDMLQTVSCLRALLREDIERERAASPAAAGDSEDAGE